ncbi:MAG: hypothetical protein AAF215_35445 [Cyanobacteria bacterium P01_A01_bin.123]
MASAFPTVGLDGLWLSTWSHLLLPAPLIALLKISLVGSGAGMTLLYFWQLL